MIFPYLKGIPSFAEAPFTWTLVYLNIIFFGVGYLSQNSVEQKLEGMWENDSFVETTGHVFVSFLENNPKEAKPLHQAIIKQSREGDSSQTRLLANLAFRNKRFLASLPSAEIPGDQVALKDWKETFIEFRDTQFEHPSYIWGLSARSEGWMNYISYQFAHGSIFHLFGNMFFLLIFGSFIEMGFGSLLFLVGYFFAGVFGAVVFATWSGVGYSPLIGASGAISGLMAFIGLLYRDRNIPCAYFILPVQEYFGLIYIPGWTILLLWLVTDIAGVIATVSEFGGVAHSAHIGGAIIGLLAAEIYRHAAPKSIPSAI